MRTRRSFPFEVDDDLAIFSWVKLVLWIFDLEIVSVGRAFAAAQGTYDAELGRVTWRLSYGGPLKCRRGDGVPSMERRRTDDHQSARRSKIGELSPTD